MGEDALPGGGEEVVQLVAPEAGEADQHNGVLRIVVRDVIRFGVVAQECRTLFEIGSDDQRAGFRRAMNREASDQPITELDRRRTVH